MDLNIVTLEISDLIVHFDYYDTLVSAFLAQSAEYNIEDHNKIRNKSKEHLAQFFAGVEFYNRNKQLKSLKAMKEAIISKLGGMKTNDVHDLVDKLAKDAKKIKKLYVSLTKKQA